MSILSSPFWGKIAPYFTIEVYGRDGGLEKPRWRIEVRKLPESVRQETMEYTMPCVACGALIHPIRQRVGGGLYFAPTCPLSWSYGCSRGKAARDEYIRVRKAVDELGETKPDNQLSLMM